MSNTIPTKITDSVSRSEKNPSQVRSEFKAILTSPGVKFSIAGTARSQPNVLSRPRFLPQHKIELFDTVFYFTDVFQIPELRFFVAYVVQPGRRGKPHIYPRIVYKDLSLCWRSASHFTYESDGDIWIGKGDVREEIHDGEAHIVSIESTTDLPLEMQSVVESLLGYTPKARNGKGVLELILKQSPSDRVEPYRDFTTPRRSAASNPANLIHKGKAVARFKRVNDPASLVFARGYEPDFKSGIIEESHSKSRLYGGKLRRFRILSVNQKIQYLFIAGRKHVWIIPPQALTTEISSYGVRTVDVVADDDLFIPGYEYHHMEDSPTGPVLYSQIPDGFAGAECEMDDAKADASPWLEKIPIIQQFRKQVLKT